MNFKKIITIFIIAFIISIFAGSTIYSIITNKTKTKEKEANTYKSASIVDIQEPNYLVEETTWSEEKASPNAILVLKKYYKGCGHAVSDKSEIPEEMVNKTAKQIQEEYKEWELEEFTEKEITLSKYVEGYCNEHYVLKEENGKVVVYEIDKEGKERVVKTTEIETEFLPETDRVSLKNGIKVFTKENLNILLQDFE